MAETDVLGGDTVQGITLIEGEGANPTDWALLLLNSICACGIFRFSNLSISSAAQVYCAEMETEKKFVGPIH